MHPVRLASVVTAIVLCGWLKGAWFQDVYRSEGRWLDDQASSYRRLEAQLGLRYRRCGEHTLHNFRTVLVSPQGQYRPCMDRFDKAWPHWCPELRKHA
jgi:hypothetical protein